MPTKSTEIVVAAETLPRAKLLPPLKWPGGKQWLVERHPDLFPERYEVYREPFIGGASVFLHLAPKHAALSDINSDLINFYRCIRRDWRSIQKSLRRFQEKHCPAFYYATRDSNPRSPTANASRFLYLMDLHTLEFELSVAIFVDIDISQQAYIFSTVNLTQTKVHRSLVYDLFDLAKTRSPQRTCHTIAVALDQSDESPFYRKIKRLGVATEGRFEETLTQSTFVEAIMPYISRDPIRDRDLLLKRKPLDRVEGDDERRMIFRNLFIEARDVEITKIILNYFVSVESRWPKSWGKVEKGNIINRTNGFRAFARFMRPAYLSVAREIGRVVAADEFSTVMDKIGLKEFEFTPENFPPGTSGEAALFRRLLDDSGLASSR